VVAANRLDKIRVMVLWGIAFTATIAFIPLQTPSPIVPIKQFALGTLGALLGIVSLSRLRLRWPTGRLAKEPYQAVWVGCAVGWVAWAMVRTLVAPRPTWYEAYWGNSDRGTGILTQLGFIGVAIAAISLSGFISGRRFVWWFAMVFGVVLLYNVGQIYGYDFVDWDHDKTYLATFGNLNQASSFYAAAAVVLGIASWDEWSETRRIDSALVCWGFGSGLALAMCFRNMMHGGKQGIFVVAITVVVFVLSSFHENVIRNGVVKRHRKWLGLAVVTAATSLVVYTLSDNGVGDRFRIWSTALAIWWSEPLAGVGIGQIQWLWYQFATAAELQSGEIIRVIDEVHSGPLQQAAQLGLPGLMSYAGVLLIPTVVAIKRMRVRCSGLTRAVAALWIVFVIQDLISPASFALAAWGAIAVGILLHVEGVVEADHRPALWRRLVAFAACIIVAMLSLQRFRTDYRLTRAWHSAGELSATSAQLRRQSMYLSTRAELVQIVALRPYDTAIAKLIATVAAQFGDPITARMIGNASLQNEPRNLRLLDLLGHIDLATGRPDSAAAHYARAAQAAPRSIATALMWDLSAQQASLPETRVLARVHLDSLAASQRYSESQLVAWRSRLANGISASTRLYRPYGQ